MKIYVHFEDHIVKLIDEYELEGHDGGYVRAPNFTIQGAYLGVTTLYLRARQHSGDVVTSQSIKVEVYSPPRLHPNEIFLVPGASYVLRIKGGPKLGAFVEYASMDEKKAKFQKLLGQISAILPGNTSLVATFYGKENIMICQAFGKIMVGVPSSAIMNVQSKQLAVGRQMPIFPSLSEGNLFSFYELCSNFKWTIEDEEVLIFHDKHHTQGVKSAIPFPSAKESRSVDYLDKEDTGFLEVLQGLSPGKTDVLVSFSCDFISSGSFSESRRYSANISLWVVPDLPLALGSPITWILPPHYTSSDLLPLSSNPRSKTSNHKGTVTYSLLKDFGEKKAEVRDDAITIDGGTIRTKEADSISCILAKDRSIGRIEVASCVRVAEVAQMRIMAENALVLKLAIGAELLLPTKCYDALGNPFHEACNATPIEFETNYPHVVTLEDSCDTKGRIHIRAKGYGKALVQVAFANKPWKSDYVMIYVGAHLHPLNPVLRLGSHLNFSINGVSGEALGHWFSANESIVYIDKLSGKSEAISEGSTQVHYESSDLKLHTVVTVIQGKLLSLEAPKEMLTNAPPFPVKGYLFPVKLADAYNHKYETLENRKKLFGCEVDPPYVGFVKPWSDPVTGSLYCIFFPHFPEQLVRMAPDFADLRQGLYISIRAALLEDNSVSASASAIFVGGFSLLETKEKSLRLNMTPDSNICHITIVGNTDVDINWHHLDKLSVRAILGEDSKKGGHVLYEVKGHSDATFKDELIITLPATGQRMGLDVIFEAKRLEGATISFYLLFLVGLLVSIACSFVAYLVYHFLMRVGSPSFFPSNTTLVAGTAPTTPLVSRSPVRDEQSPRTPLPFIDYVRRTIDETPYYRQDFRRRVNPQNTM